MRYLMMALAAVVLALGAFGARAADEGIAWSTDLDKALVEAGKSGKPVFIDFYAEWCGWCKALEEKTYPDAGVQGLARRYVCVKVDTDKHPDLGQRYKVQGLPTLVILDSKGQEIRRVEGFRGPELFTQELQKGLSGDKTPPAPLPTAPAPGDPAPQQGGMQNPLPEMAARMTQIRTRLESEDTGKGTQQEQEKLLTQLEEMIQQAQKSSGG